MDHFLQSSESVCCSLVRANRQAETGGKKQSLVKAIAHILGIKDYEGLAPSSSLSELGMDSLMGVEVKQTLERDYEVILSMQELRALTISNLIEIGGDSSNFKSSDSGPGKLELSIPKISLPTEQFVRLNDIKEGRPIFFLPPIEGTFELLQVLAQKLNRPAIGLNWTLELVKLKSIEEASNYFLERTKKFVTSDESLDLVGYSFGSVLAYDMALQLQQTQNRNNVKLLFLDASPIHLFITTEQYRYVSQANDEDSKFIEALVIFLIQIASVNYVQIKEQLSSLDGKESRLKKAAQILSENGIPDSKPEEIEIAAQAFISKALMMHSYQMNKKFTGDITLLRAEEILVQSKDLTEDYGISEVSTI